MDMTVEMLKDSYRPFMGSERHTALVGGHILSSIFQSKCSRESEISSLPS